MLNFHAPVKIGDVVNVIVEVTELVREGRKVEAALRGDGGQYAGAGRGGDRLGSRRGRKPACLDLQAHRADTVPRARCRKV